MKKVFMSLLKALLISVITMAVLLFLFAFIASVSEDPTKNLGIFGRVIFFVSAFAGCFFICRQDIMTPLAGSLIYAFVYLLAGFFVSLIIGKGAVGELLIPYLSVLAIALLTPFAGTGRRTKKPKSLKAFKKMKRA